MDGTHPRFGLTLMVNHACNLRCTYCYTGAKFSSPMPLTLGEVAINRALRSLTTSGALDVGFFGGEPLLEPDRILHWMRFARTRSKELGSQVRFHVTTNGTLDQGEAWEVMLADDLDLAVSFDGLPRTHDRHRRTVAGQGTSKLVETTLCRLIERARDFRVNVVVRPDNLEDLPSGLIHLQQLGVRQVELSLDLWTVWSREDVRRLETFVQRAAELWHGWLPDFGLSWFDGKLADLARLPRSFETTRCGFGYGEIAIAPSGNLYPCERLIGEDQEGHPFRLSGYVMDGGEGFDMKAPAFAACQACESCLIASSCDTGCRCSNLIRTGHPNTPDALLCRLNQATADAVSRVMSSRLEPRECL